MLMKTDCTDMNIWIVTLKKKTDIRILLRLMIK